MFAQVKNCELKGSTHGKENFYLQHANVSPRQKNRAEEVNIQLLAKVTALGKEAPGLSYLNIPKKEQNSLSLTWILTVCYSRYKHL